ncbi:MAG TPA: hypothetical protein VI136_23795 [Verrucomicrobiae bacterium]
MSRNRQVLHILGLTLLLASGFALVARVAAWRAEIAETNSQANVIRLQAFLFDASPRAVLVGSSLFGRLLPSCFEGTPITPVANLGLDGSGAVFGLDLVLRRPPPLVFVEVNTLLNPSNANEEVMADTLRSLHFRAAKFLPVLRADFRPSSILYSWAKSQRTQTREFTPRPNANSAPTNPPAQVSLAPFNAAGSPEIRAKLRSQIRALQDRGCRVILVRMPASHRFTSANNASFALGDELAKELKLPQYDLDDECVRRGIAVKYTDGVHLSPQAAREAARVLAELVAKPEIAGRADFSH